MSHWLAGPSRSLTRPGTLHLELRAINGLHALLKLDLSFASMENNLRSHINLKVDNCYYHIKGGLLVYYCETGETAFTLKLLPLWMVIPD